MKYNHMVKVKGQYYPAGTEVPELDSGEENLKISQQESEGEAPEDTHKESKDEIPKDDTDGAEVEKQPAKRGRKPAASQTVKE